jgi:hypothetical protein
MTGMSGFGTTGSVVSVGLEGCVGVDCVFVGSVAVGLSGVTGSSGPTADGRFSIRSGGICTVIGEPCCTVAVPVGDFSTPTLGISDVGKGLGESDSGSGDHGVVGRTPSAGT